MPQRTRAAIMAPYRRDAELIAKLAVEAGADPRVCRSPIELGAAVAEGFGVVILTEEGCTLRACAALARVWRHEPAWSSPTMIALVSRAGRLPEPLHRLLVGFPLISCLRLQRPLDRETLVSAIRNQLGFRNRQLQLRDLIEEAEAREDHERFLRGELDHRVKNMLANLNGLLTLTASSAKDVPSFVRSFRGRVTALSRVHERLADRVWDRVPLADLVSDSLEPFIADTRQLEAEGPRVLVDPRPAVSLTMALHELATNANKYGALSKPEGIVTIDWSRQPAAAGRDEVGRLLFEWRERDGPRIAPPDRQGFGTRLLRQVVEHDLGGRAATRYEPDGLYARLEFPLRLADPLVI